MSTTKAQPPSLVNTFYSQLHFQCNIKLNKGLEAHQTKSAFFLGKVRGSISKIYFSTISCNNPAVNCFFYFWVHSELILVN